MGKVTKAIEFAIFCHKNQKRLTGEDFVCHPLKVATEVANYSSNEDDVIAALLHDTVEDTKVTLCDIHNRFGEKVSKIVEGVSRKNTLQKNIFLNSIKNILEPKNKKNDTNLNELLDKK